jgi:hypothetical protein
MAQMAGSAHETDDRSFGSVASFHLITERAGRAPAALSRLSTDRLRLRHTPGLRFWRLLGTGRGSSTAPSIDPRRTALFAVWDDVASLGNFQADHPLPARWRQAEEAWHLRMTMVGGGGTWNGRSFVCRGDLGPSMRADAPIVVITHAAVAALSWRQFRATSKLVAAELSRADGLLASVAIGEAPLGRLGTLSVWSTPASAQGFASSTVHRAAAERARSEAWFNEELFARFSPVATSGLWGGNDPLAGRLHR